MPIAMKMDFRPVGCASGAPFDLVDFLLKTMVHPTKVHLDS